MTDVSQSQLQDQYLQEVLSTVESKQARGSFGRGCATNLSKLGGSARSAAECVHKF